MSALTMFPNENSAPEDADLLAGEYTLGVMDAGEAAAVRIRADTDPAMRSAIIAWQARLAQIAAMLAPAAPPPELWQRLAADIGMPAPTPPPPAPPPPAPPKPTAIPPTPIEPPAAPVAAEPVFVEPALTEPPIAEVAAPETVTPPSSPSPPPPAPVLKFSMPIPMPEPPSPPVPAPAPAPAPALAPAPAPAPAPALAPPPPPPAPSAPPPIFSAPLPVEWHPNPTAHTEAPAETPRQRAERWLQSLLLWRIAAAALLVLATGLGVALWRSGVAPQAVAAIGVANAPAPLFLAQADPDGSLRISPLAVIAVPNGRDLQLWMQLPKDQEPHSLGILSAAGSTVSLGGPPVEGTRLLISLEPRGGASSGRITGQVLYGGTLANR